MSIPQKGIEGSNPSVSATHVSANDRFSFLGGLDRSSERPDQVPVAWLFSRHTRMEVRRQDGCASRRSKLFFIVRSLSGITKFRDGLQKRVPFVQQGLENIQNCLCMRRFQIAR